MARNSFELPEDIRGYDTKPGLVKRGTKEEKEGLDTLRADATPNTVTPIVTPSAQATNERRGRAKVEEQPKVAPVVSPVVSSTTKPPAPKQESVAENALRREAVEPSSMRPGVA